MVCRGGHWPPSVFQKGLNQFGEDDALPSNDSKWKPIYIGGPTEVRRGVCARIEWPAAACRRKGEDFMQIAVGDILVMKKNHPCGENRFLVLRIGMDFKLRCLGCGREIMVPRSKAEKSVRCIEQNGED